MTALLRHNSLAIIVMGLLLAGFSLTLVSGLYPDEIAYKIFLERFFITGGFRQSVTPFCMESFLTRPPLLLLPAAMFWAQLTHLGSSWLSYRFVPYVGFLLIGFVLVRHNIFFKNRNFWPLLLPVIFGPTLFALTMLRPEIIILTGGVLLFYVGTLVLREQSALRLCLLNVTAFLLYSLLIYVHPKALYLIIVPVLSVIFSTSCIKKLWQKLLYVALCVSAFLFLAATTVSFHNKIFLSCASAPETQKAMSAQAVNPLDLLGNAPRFFENLREALSGKAIKSVYEQMLYQPSYEIDFLPPHGMLRWRDKIGNAFITTVILGLLLFCVTKIICGFLWIKDPQTRKSFYLVVATAVGFMTPFAFNITRHFYEVGFFIGALVCSAVLLWPLRAALPSFERVPLNGGMFLKKASVYIVFTALVCIVLSYQNYVVPLLAGYRGPDLPSGLDQSKINMVIHSMLAEAKIDEQQPMIISDLSYEAVKQHPYVVPATYMPMAFVARGVTAGYLQKFGIRYGVAECSIVESLRNPDLTITFIAQRRYEQTIRGDVPIVFDICVFEVVF